MEAKELRIGNLIERNGVIAKIEVINNEIDEIYFIGDDFYYSDFCCNINPIKITEEWLLKFGFIKSDLDSDNAWLNLRYRFLNFSSDESVFFEKVYLTLNKMDIICSYVHELQNLYFALTGQELTIKQ